MQISYYQSYYFKYTHAFVVEQYAWQFGVLDSQCLYIELLFSVSLLFYRHMKTNAREDLATASFTAVVYALK